MNLSTKIRRFLENEEGPTSVEYAILLALIIAVVFSVVQTLGGTTSSMFEDIADDMDTVQQISEQGSL